MLADLSVLAAQRRIHIYTQNEPKRPLTYTYMCVCVCRTQYEYLTLCEKLNAEPVWVVQSGVSQTESVSPEQLKPWIQVRQ